MTKPKQKRQPIYTAWTAKAVELRILEAAETCLRLPPVKGPQVYGNNMPEPVRRQIEAYGSNKPKFRRNVDRSAIARMEETWTWINTYLSEADRHLVYGWSHAKKRKRRSVARFARQNHCSERTMYRWTRQICSRIAGKLNEFHVPSLTMSDFDQISGANQLKSKISVQPNETYWRAPGSKPMVAPELAKSRTVRAPRKPRKREPEQVSPQ